MGPSYEEGGPVFKPNRPSNVQKAAPISRLIGT